MTFSILDHLDSLAPAKDGKYICPACGGNNLSVNKATGAYSCFSDPSANHRAEIRNALAPMQRWEKPPRLSASHTFHYGNDKGETIVLVHREDDENGSKRLWQTFPSIDSSVPASKALLQEAKASLLPWNYKEAMEKSKADGLPIFIVEGELKAKALWDLGLPAITFLGGSKQYRSNGDYSRLFANTAIVLCPDRDEPGIAFMREVEADNPGAQWLYADPASWEWNSLPAKNGYDIGDWIDDGATKDEILSSIVSKSRHHNDDGKPSYEETISKIEEFVGLYGTNDARILYESSAWLERRGVKLTQQTLEKIVEEAKGKVYGKEEIETVDALAIIEADHCREWLIAGIVPRGTVMLLAAKGGVGKAQPLWAKVLTPSGWKAMGEIVAGDLVIDKAGKQVNVLRVFPQGKKPIFKVTMSDGSFTHCCDEHLWLAKTQRERDKGADWNVYSLNDIRSTLHLHKNNGRKDRNYSIPMVGPVQFLEQDLPLHPYLLGVILGDGCVVHGNCTVTLSDDEIKRRIETLLPPGNSLKAHNIRPKCITYGMLSNGHQNCVRNHLRDLGIYNCHSWEKYVPEQYLFGSVQQRLDLLHGLMDTDGTTGGDSTTFDSASEALRDAVVFLVQSLGGKATKSERQPWFTYKGERKPGRTSYRAFISIPPAFQSFSITAKKIKEIVRTKYVPTRMISSIEYIGEHDAQCIMVDSPSSSYITDDFIVTHNTSVIYNWALRIALGESWSKRRCLQGKSLLISCDEPISDTSEKLSIIGYQDAGLKPGDISFWENWRFAHMQQLEDYVRKHRPILVCIDSLTSCLAGMNVDLTKSSSGDVIYGLRDLANVYNCTIIILHHLNKSGGLRDSSAFVDNVSEVVKLDRMESYDSNQFSLEWLKSRAGLTGKHVLIRKPSNYGWEYGGPLGGSAEDLDKVVLALAARRNQAFSSRQVGALVGSLDYSGTRTLLEVARRQGLITSSWQTGSNGERERLYHDWNAELDPEPSSPPLLLPEEEELF